MRYHKVAVSLTEQHLSKYGILNEGCRSINVGFSCFKIDFKKSFYNPDIDILICTVGDDDGDVRDLCAVAVLREEHLGGHHLDGVGCVGGSAHVRDLAQVGDHVG